MLAVSWKHTATLHIGLNGRAPRGFDTKLRDSLQTMRLYPFYEVVQQLLTFP